MNSQIITISPDILCGKPVFTGTRVPVKILFDYLKGGDSLGEFLEDYPSVSKEQALKVLTISSSIFGINDSMDEAVA